MKAIIDFSKNIGKIKPVNGVSNGPICHNVDLSVYFKESFIPMVRLHNRDESSNFGGITAFIVPELNDAYSGFISNQAYRSNWYNSIIDDKDVYFALLKRLIYGFCVIADLHPNLLTSHNAKYGTWKKENNAKIFEEIENL